MCTPRIRRILPRGQIARHKNATAWVGQVRRHDDAARNDPLMTVRRISPARQTISGPKNSFAGVSGCGRCGAIEKCRTIHNSDRPICRLGFRLFGISL
jgi:hypothetical protein